MVCALSHQALGVKVAPARGRSGVPLNVAQREMTDFLLKLSRSMVRLSSPELGCGLRLPAVKDHLNQLRSELSACDVLPYARSKRSFGEKSSDAAFAATKALPVVAERLSLPSQVSNFDPRPYLSEKFREIYENPDVILKAPEDMPPPMHIKGTATRAELLKVFSRWDVLDRLFVCRSDEVCSLDRCELFAVAKDMDKDRQILHRKRRNKREYHVVGESRNLPHGVLLTQLPLGKDKVCVCSVDDIRDFYHAYEATEARARSSPVGPILRWGEVAHLNAAKAALAANRITKHDKLVCCFRGLGMGDHAAVDIAQESHVNLLRSRGALLPDETLNYRQPIPKPESGFYEGIMIDDHLGVQLLPWKGSVEKTLSQPGRDVEAFAQAGSAYNSVKLRTHEGKEVRRAFHARVWGAEVEGIAGLIGPARNKLLKLAQLSVLMTEAGPVDEKMIEAITGLWAFNLQFRRPLFSFMYEIYHQLSPGDPGELFKLSPGARNELLVLACCAPLCICDARALPDPFLYCVDASPSGAGVCRVEVGEMVSEEVWRRGDKVGYRMPLLTRLQSTLKGSGHNEEDLWDSSSDESIGGGGEACDWEHGFLDCLRKESPALVLSEEPFDLLEISAECGQMSQSWIRKRLRVLPPLDLKKGWSFMDPQAFVGLMSFIKARKVKFLWWAPPRTTFSLARTPKVRSLDDPWGFDVLTERVVEGNLHVCQCILLAGVQMAVGNFMTGETPARGCLKAFPPWIHLTTMTGVFELLFDWCRFGQSCRKTTKLISNFPPVRRLGLRCCHQVQQRHLVAKGVKGENTTNWGVYSNSFCDRVADVFVQWALVVSPPNPFGMDAPEGLLCAGDGDRNTSHFCQRVDSTLAPRQRRKRKGGSALWAVQLSEGLTWKPWIKYQFRQKEHINLQETKARRTLFKRLGRDKRVVVAQDSRVNIGSLGKGRSPSASLNRIMRSEAPYILGKNLHVSSIHFPTWSLRADGPSRNHQVLGARTPLPVWFWKLRTGAREALIQLDELQGLPRAYNRWFLLAGSLLLRNGERSSQTSSDAGARPCFDRARSCDGPYSEHPTGPAYQTGGLVGNSTARGYFGGFGSASHRCFVRVARRIYGHLISGWSEPQVSSRDSECGGPKVWLAQILSCRALERTQDMGHVGASHSSPAYAGASALCSCGYCHGMAVAALCGVAGTGLFWIIETLRAYRFATTRSVSPARPLGRQCDLHSSFPAENSFSGSCGATCAPRRGRHRRLGADDLRLDADVAEALVRLFGFFQNQAGLGAA